MSTIATRPKVLAINHSVGLSAAYLAEMDALVDFVYVDQAPHDILAVRIKDAVEALKSEGGHFVACIVFLKWRETWPWPLDEGLVGPLIENGCKMFASGGAGYDFVDIPYLTAHGAFYANTAVSASVRTADSAAMMILQVLRHTGRRDEDVRAGRWQVGYAAKDARKTTLGIIGMGTIGRLVKDHMQHFGMKVIYYNRSRLTPAEETGAEYCAALEDVLKRADVVSFHCPLTEQTRHLLNKDTLALTKPGVLIVNTSRGPVVHEQALVDALESGHVAGVALDVFEFEPKVHPRLVEMRDKTILQPHCAVMNETIMEDQQTEVLQNLEAFIKTGTPNTPVNHF